MKLSKKLLPFTLIIIMIIPCVEANIFENVKTIKKEMTDSNKKIGYVKRSPEYIEPSAHEIKKSLNEMKITNKNEKINNDDYSSLNITDDYFYFCDFYAFDGNSDGTYDSIMANFDVDTYADSDFVTVRGYMYDDNYTLIDGPISVSY